MNNNLFIPGAIVLAGTFIALAVVLSGGQSNTALDTAVVADGSPMRVTDRNVFGELNAPTTIVEFSDYECPFCSRLHPTLERLVVNSEGRVNWEYRHLPLPMHGNAEGAAVAAECVAKLGGNDAFWDFSHTLLQNQRGLSSGLYMSAATALGIDQEKFSNCLTDQKIIDRIAVDEATAAAFGGRGTPFSVIHYSDGTTRAVSGALPYENWAALVGL